MKTKSLSLFLISAIMCCLFSGCSKTGNEEVVTKLTESVVSNSAQDTSAKDSSEKTTEENESAKAIKDDAETTDEVKADDNAETADDAKTDDDIETNDDIKNDDITETEEEDKMAGTDALPRFYISKEREEKKVDGDYIGEYSYDQIHIESEGNAYKTLENELDRINSDIASQEQEVPNEDCNICVRRADEDVMSFVTEYSWTGDEGGYIEIRGHSYDMKSGSELQLTDIVKDEELFYDTLATELSYVVTRKMIAYTGENDMELIDCKEAMEECIRENRAGWVLDPQGITFWFDNINAVLSCTTASVLFIDDTDGAIFKNEYITKAPEEWIMQVPGHFTETKFDYGLDGSTDTISWGPGEAENDVYGTYTSGICVNYNAKYYDAADICPGDGLPWENYEAMLIYKDKKAVLLISHDEDIVSYIDTFDLKNDEARKADNMVGALAWISSPTSYGVYVPTDPSAIEIHTVLDAESEEDAKSQYLSVDADGMMTVKGANGDVSEESDKKKSDSTESTGQSLSDDDAIEIGKNLGGTLCALECRDYDGDGTKEAFAVTGSEDEFGGYLPETVWFIAGDGTTTKMRTDFENMSMYRNDEGYYIEYAKENKGFFTAECGGYGSGWLSFIFSVKDGEPYELDLSMKIEGFYQPEPGVFQTLTDDFTDGHKYMITELIYDSKTGQFKKGKVTDKEWAL
ncbi:hypothetical protein [Butyrivibrio sp. AC2005]|uniref:hypothetical protein n=1 Tax=Butyrivibrio sp. AC2005 TaxID=1280672 RepID=UPI000410E39F|nr:hypothetical protein [Butyrivibrio sp. AC2005]